MCGKFMQRGRGRPGKTYHATDVKGDPLTFKYPHYNREGREEGLGTRLGMVHLSVMFSGTAQSAFEKTVSNIFNSSSSVVHLKCRTIYSTYITDIAMHEEDG